MLRPLELAVLALLGVLLNATPGVIAAPAGKVLYANGAATARQADGELRFLGKGMEILEGDTVTTGKRGFVILHMVDDGKMTLRPNSELHIERYDERDSGTSIALELLRGGLRSLSGLFARRRSASYRLRASVATIGIRGTEFDVRICEGDCVAESSGKKSGRAGTAAPLAGRVIIQRGSVSAEKPSGASRAIGKGSRIYMGDAVVTGDNSVVVIVFRDDTRMVVQSRSRFIVDRYFYEPDEEQPSTFFRLVRGGLRVLTGLTARRNPRGFRLSTSTATIGIRGTGFDVVADEECEAGATAAHTQDADPDDCSYVSVWQGRVEANGVGLDEGETGYIADADGAPVKLDETPQFIAENEAPRPDQFDVDLDELFGIKSPDAGEPGVYVSANDGEIIVETPAGELVITRGEAAHVNPGTGDIKRLSGQPLFLLDDPYPMPSRFDEEIERAFDLFGGDLDGFNKRDTLECKIN